MRDGTHVHSDLSRSKNAQWRHCFSSFVVFGIGLGQTDSLTCLLKLFVSVSRAVKETSTTPCRNSWTTEMYRLYVSMNEFKRKDKGTTIAETIRPNDSIASELCSNRKVTKIQGKGQEATVTTTTTATKHVTKRTLRWTIGDDVDKISPPIPEPSTIRYSYRSDPAWISVPGSQLSDSTSIPAEVIVPSWNDELLAPTPGILKILCRNASGRESFIEDDATIATVFTSSGLIERPISMVPHCSTVTTTAASDPTVTLEMSSNHQQVQQVFVSCLRCCNDETDQPFKPIRGEIQGLAEGEEEI